MWHEIAHAVSTGSNSQPPSDTSSNLIVAFIGAIAALIVAFSGLIGAVSHFLRHRSPREPVPPVPLNTGTSEHESSITERNAAYETFLMRLHFNPNKIVTGEEEFGVVHFD